MRRQNIQTIPLRRKREGKTNYKKRIALISSEKPRLVIRKSLTRITVQLITFDPKGDVVKVGVTSKELEKFGWKGNASNTPAAYLTGYLIAKKAAKAGVKEAVVDIGFHTSLRGASIFATVKGAVDGGLSIPYSEEALPSEERIQGKHIENFANNIEEIKKKMESL